MTDSETIRSHSHRVSQTVAILVLLTCLLMPDMASAYKGHYHGGHHYGYLALGLGIAHLAYRGHGGRHRYHHYSYYPYGHQYGHSRPYRNYPYDRNYYRYRPRLSNAVEADYGRTQASVVAATAAEPDAGWSLLKRGEARQAVKAFARTATDAPDKGAPKVGYALASATSGDLRQGARAMRRALRVDADALHYLALDQDLERIINTVITTMVKPTVICPDRTPHLCGLLYITSCVI